MLGSEKNLLLAVRNRLRNDGGYQDNQCEIEHDEAAQPTTGDTYAVVMPAGFTPGPRHRTSGGIRDLVFAVDVMVIKRISHVPRDRTREMYLGNLSSLAVEIEKIIDLIDFRYEVINDANELLLADNQAGASYGFYEPLRFAGVERRPRIIGGEMFSETKNVTRVGLARTIAFSGARRTTIKS